jgi:hypothetical protein
VLASKVPNLVDPVTKSTDDVIVCTISVCAVIVPDEVILPTTFKEPVMPVEPVILNILLPVL